MTTRTPIIATVDIETSPYEVYTWGMWKQNVGVEQIKEERTILSFGYKALGQKPVYMDVSGSGAKKVRQDKALVLALAERLNQTDIVIAQNGRAFDIHLINARMVMHDIPPYSPIRVVDTKEVAKRYFAFGHNSLAWLSKHLTDTPKDDHKEFPGMELWLECLKDNPAAWAVMRKYNLRDVLSTEKLYLKMRPWITNHPNLGVYTGTGFSCPNCGSTNVQKRGIVASQASRYQQYRCNNCGRWPRDKIMLSSIKERKGRLT